MDMEIFKNKLKEAIPDGITIDKDLLDKVVGGVDAGLFSESDVLAELKSGGANLAGMLLGVAKPDGSGGGLKPTKQ